MNRRYLSRHVWREIGRAGKEHCADVPVDRHSEGATGKCDLRQWSLPLAGRVTMGAGSSDPSRFFRRLRQAGEVEVAPVAPIYREDAVLEAEAGFELMTLIEYMHRRAAFGSDLACDLYQVAAVIGLQQSAVLPIDHQVPLRIPADDLVLLHNGLGSAGFLPRHPKRSERIGTEELWHAMTAAC